MNPDFQPKHSHTFIFLSLAVALVAPQAHADTPDLSHAATCATAQERFFSDGDVKVVCNDSYQLYNADAPKTYYKAKKNQPFSYASFNMLHMGDNLARFKDYATFAAILNQWDLVASVEVQPLPKDDAKRNEDLAKFLKRIQGGETIKDEDGKNVTAARVLGDFTAPGYVKVLKELMKLDPSWALILAPVEAGEGSHTELGGFFFRATKVEPKKVKGCDNQLGCMSTFPPASRIAVARPPFVAGFESGSFDFISLALHLRFRVPTEAGAMAKIKKIFNGPDFGVTSDEDIARFAELKTIMKFAGTLAKAGGEKDVVVSGDFNLEPKDSRKDAWAEVIKGLDGAQVFVTDQTSLSKLNGLASEYDHYVMSPSNTGECTPDQAHSFNFLDSHTAPMVASSIHHLATQRKALEKALKAAYTVKGNRYVRLYTDDQVDAELAEFDRRLVDSQNDDQTPYLVYEELVSDHVPVVMSCTSGTSDDD